jgi:hypothetical protein
MLLAKERRPMTDERITSTAGRTPPSAASPKFVREGRPVLTLWVVFAIGLTLVAGFLGAIEAKEAPGPPTVNQVSGLLASDPLSGTTSRYDPKPITQYLPPQTKPADGWAYTPVIPRTTQKGYYEPKLIPYPLDKPVSVRGYVRKDGTYVQPHFRSLPRR